MDEPAIKRLTAASGGPIAVFVAPFLKPKHVSMSGVLRLWRSMIKLLRGYSGGCMGQQERGWPEL